MDKSGVESYRITGNFLNWVTEKYDTNIVRKLNAAARAGNYGEEVWKTSTGKTPPELGEEWKKAHEERLSAESGKATPPEESKKEKATTPYCSIKRAR